ncbi:MAG: acyl-CoA thioesterase [Gammaproteobacteria bacterium]|nr:acyl-CoA thioesterase [Gammaproteobacteria bacterium]
MNLVFRMLGILMASFFKPRLPAERLKNDLSMRVLPNDIDINMHMNNGRYLTICDLTRVDMFIRTGLARLMIQERWTPAIAEHTMKYKKGLKLFQKYDVFMEVTHWDNRAFFMNHRFVVGGRVVAEGTSLGVIVSKDGLVSPEKVMDKLNTR